MLAQMPMSHAIRFEGVDEGGPGGAVMSAISRRSRKERQPADVAPKETHHSRSIYLDLLERLPDLVIASQALPRERRGDLLTVDRLLALDVQGAGIGKSQTDVSMRTDDPRSYFVSVTHLKEEISCI